MTQPDKGTEGEKERKGERKEGKMKERRKEKEEEEEEKVVKVRIIKFPDRRTLRDIGKCDL